MQQLLILSGKGGTGKTTIASALIQLSGAKAYADCDVDAPNLHLIAEQSCQPIKKEYYGMPKAVINSGLCIQCDRCRQSCRFDAITAQGGYRVEPFACEGCGVCQMLCPVSAVSLNPAVAGELMLYADEASVFSTAQLKMGSGTSGKLVTEVKKQMSAAAAPETRLSIIDGSPGIGCPVIASLSGADLALIVTEPSQSGISDMERVLETAAKFGTNVAVCVNKYDINLPNTIKIETFCQVAGVPFVGRVPFDPDAQKAINSRRSIVDLDCRSGEAVKEIYQKIIKLLFNREGEMG